MGFIKTMALGLSLAAFTASSASAITYTVDLAFGGNVSSEVQRVDTGSTSVSVTGEIETDGTLGALDVANIVGWNFVVSDGYSSVSFGNADSSSSLRFDASGAMTATATELFDGDKGWMFYKTLTTFRNDSTAYLVYSNQGKGPRTSVGFEQIGATGYDTLAYGYADERYTDYAKLGQVAAVPVPASALLLISGLGLIGSTRLRKKAA